MTFYDHFHDHFSGHADGYAAHRPTYPPALVDWLAELSPRTGLAWEAGCGSGQLSVALAERFDRVIATDASAEQLARAAPHPRVEYVRAKAEDSGLPDGNVEPAPGPGEPTNIDLAVAAQAAHWFDIEAYFAEIRRVAAPGAAVSLVSYGPTRISPSLDPIFEEFRIDVLAPHWPPQRRHVEDGYRSLPFPFDEVPASELPELEIRLEWTLDELLAYVRTWSALRGMEPAQATEIVEELRRRMAPAWGPTSSARVVTWPLALRAGYV